MTGQPDAPRNPSPLDSEFLDGHAIESLSDYLDRDRMPRDPAIEASPGAQNALAALARLRAIAPRVVAAEADSFRPRHDHWIKRILDQIGVQAHAGRDISIAHDVPVAVLSISEGAARAIVRDVGDEFDGMLVERVVLDGELESHGAQVTITVYVVMFPGTDRARVGEDFGLSARSALTRHTELAVTDVVVKVRDADQSDDVERE